MHHCYNQRKVRYKAVLAVYIAAKEVLPTLHYLQDELLKFQKWVCRMSGKFRNMSYFSFSQRTLR